MTELAAFDYGHDGVALTGRLALPQGAGGRRPGVLVMHDAMGIGPMVERRTAELAGLGYVALASDMYGPEIHSGEPEVHGRLFMALHERPEHLRARVVAGFEALRARPEVDPDCISAIGYCFGGQCVLELARSGATVRSVVSLHGLLTTRLLAEPGAVKARVLTITGARDPYAPASDLQAFQEEFTAAGADWQATVYGEGFHAFTDPDAKRAEVPGVRYDPFLDRLSWASTLEFLAATLQVAS